MSRTGFLFNISKILNSIKTFWFPSGPTMQHLVLEEALAARGELLCLLSWFNEISCRDPRFDELVYRLEAAEKMYMVCLKRVQEEGIKGRDVLFLPEGPRRGITLNGHWYGW